MKGLHITADLHGCQPLVPEALTHQRYLAGLINIAVRTAGLSIITDAWHTFTASSREVPGGITGTLLLAESHLAIHTWPELSAVTLDIYVCNYSTDNSAKAEQVLSRLLTHFNPTTCEINRIHRGELKDTGVNS